MSPPSPLVSVIVPARNRRATVGEAMETVLAQTFRDLELLVVDDASSDGTGAAIAEIATRDPRARLVLGRGTGVSAARNAALREARGQIITYLDSDDLWFPDHLERVVAVLVGKLRATAYAGVKVTRRNPATGAVENELIHHDYDAKRILRGNSISLIGFAHTRDLYAICGGFDESMTRLVDWDLILRMTAIAPPIKIDAVTSEWRQYDDPSRVSKSIDYKSNRFLIALKHRIGERPRVRVFGGDDAALLPFVGRGLSAERAQKTDALEPGAFSNEDVIVWHWTSWDEHPNRLEAVGKNISAASGLSLYVVPEGAPVDRVLGPGLHRKFELLIAANKSEKGRLERAIAAKRTAPESHPIDIILLAKDATAIEDDYEKYLDRLAAPPRKVSRPRPRILYCFGSETANSTRKRCHEIAKALQGHFEVRTQSFDRLVPEDVVDADLIVLQRWTDQWPDRPRVAFEAMVALRRAGKLFAYDIDDYVVHSGELPMQFLRSVDAVLVSTPKLAELLGPIHPRVFVLPNGIDAERYLPVEPRALGPGKHVVLASIDGMGLATLGRIVERVIARVPEVQFHFVSNLVPPPELPRVKTYPLLDSEALMSLMKGASVVLNLSTPSSQLVARLDAAKIAPGPFVDAKSEIKFQEAGLARAVFITEDRPVIYRSVVRHEENGLIVDSDEALIEALSSALSNPELARSLTETAYQDVLREHTLAARWPAYVKVFEALDALRVSRSFEWLEEADFAAADPAELRRHLFAVEGTVRWPVPDDGRPVSELERVAGRIGREIHTIKSNPSRVSVLVRRLVKKVPRPKR